MERFLPGAMSTEGEPLEITDFTFSEESGKVVIGVVFHSPLTLPVTIKELTAEFSLDGNTIIMNLPEEVTIPAQGSASFTLEGLLPEGQSPPAVESTEAFVLKKTELTLDVGGIELKLGNLGAGV